MQRRTQFSKSLTLLVAASPDQRPVLHLLPRLAGLETEDQPSISCLASPDQRPVLHLLSVDEAKIKRCFKFIAFKGQWSIWKLNAYKVICRLNSKIQCLIGALFLF